MKHSYEQANQAMLCLISKARKLQLPIDIQLELFDSLTCPILLQLYMDVKYGDVKILC